MPVPTDITAGTITITNGSTALTGIGTAWLASDIRQGDLFIWIEGGDGFWQPIVESVESNTAVTLAEPWEGPTLTGVPYRLRYQWDSSRVSAQSRQLIDLLGNGNVVALAGLTGPGVPVFNGPHSMEVKPESDFINGVSYDVQVDSLSDRDAYNAQPEGFSVLVSDVGDGRSALYSKASATSGDWTDPAYITGPVGGSGPYTEITVGPTTTLSPGSPATVTPVVVDADTIRLDFGLPRGADGVGTGDVVGPASSTANRYARYADTTGKLLINGPDGIPNADLATMATARIKGRATAGTGAPEDLTPAQARSVMSVREMLTANRTYYVRTDGNDSNDGLANTSGGAFLTLQRAVNAAVSLDLSIYSININVADGTYTAGASLPAYVGVGPINIIGNVTTPGNVILNTAGTSLSCIGGNWSIDGVRVNSSAGGGISATGGILTVKQIVFGACSAGHIIAASGGKVYLTNNYSIVGVAPVHFYVIGGGQVVAQNALTLTITGTPAFGVAFLSASGLSYLSIANITYSGAATGVRYTITTNSVAMTGGATLPGSAAGTVATGGQYS